VEFLGHTVTLSNPLRPVLWSFCFFVLWWCWRLNRVSCTARLALHRATHQLCHWVLKRGVRWIDSVTLASHHHHLSPLFPSPRDSSPSGVCPGTEHPLVVGRTQGRSWGPSVSPTAGKALRLCRACPRPAWPGPGLLQWMDPYLGCRQTDSR
jgi:hypothetical protein